MKSHNKLRILLSEYDFIASEIEKEDDGAFTTKCNLHTFLMMNDIFFFQVLFLKLVTAFFFGKKWTLQITHLFSNSIQLKMPFH